MSSKTYVFFKLFEQHTDLWKGKWQQQNHLRGQRDFPVLPPHFQTGTEGREPGVLLFPLLPPALCQEYDEVGGSRVIRFLNSGQSWFMPVI